MKKTHRFFLIAVLATLTAAGLCAQPAKGDTAGGTETTTRPGNNNGNGDAQGRPEEKGRPNEGRPKGPSENASDNAKAVHAVQTEFRQRRDEYLTNRRELLERLKNATEDERKQILEQLRADKDARREEERSLGKQIREELRRLREQRKSGGGE